MIAARRDMVSLLLQKGADANLVAPVGKYRGWTALHYICMKVQNESKAVECISLMLAHGANPNMEIPTPLLIATNCGPYPLVVCWLKTGRIQRRSGRGLCLAIRKGKRVGGRLCILRRLEARNRLYGRFWIMVPTSRL
ncbi:hypothetical protein K440DRAFT_306806 [Wilcoxina mikolae CBS 423.85]|nr:hypothetical protein K440DRAFT_306806 [Wilcoxina mikolae CBS 423.85]